MSDPQVPVSEPLNLVPLAPNYSDADHGLYVAALERAIDEHPTTVRNIALAGPYGVGKSSVLDELARRRKRRVIGISLLTLGVAPETPPAGEGVNPAANTTSNRIQKEIVKQLLYQQSPKRTTLSRFRRIDRPHWGEESLVALVIAVITVGLLMVSGMLTGVADLLSLRLPTFPDSVRWWTVGALALGAVVAVVFLLRMIARGRVGIDKVAAGPAAISLSPRSTSYFDEYLDEIVYFFELNPKRDIVIIEDLDRFDVPAIYESLRALNSLLNASQQLGTRDIRFVYAVRDSIFEKLGRSERDATVDDTRAELARANRTKFFELIIPIVPFITHKNAREVMHGVLEERGHKIDRKLIDLAARHLPDMRTIHNVVNEYEVYRRKLIEVETPVPGLTPERLFAMMLFKNTQAADFEAVRRSESSLDQLYDVWRLLVTQNLMNLHSENEQLRSRLNSTRAANEYAARLSKALHGSIAAFASVHNGLTESTIYDEQGPVSESAMSTASFWRAVIHGTKTLTIHYTVNYYQQSANLTPAAISGLTGLSLDDSRFVEQVAVGVQQNLQRNASHIVFLQRRHTWKELFERPDLRFASEETGQRSFAEWADALLPSSLIYEMVEAGFITSYFPLYVSTFYGKLLPPDAMTYIMRNVDGGTADMDFPLSADDVDAILEDQGSPVFNSRSMRNLDILNRLLDTRPDGAKTIIERAIRDSTGVLLVDRYLESGSEKEAFVTFLAPHWPAVIRYVVEDAPLDAAERLRLVSIAMKHRDDAEHDYEYGDQVREYIEEHVVEFATFREARSAEDANHAVAALTASGAVLPSVDGLPTAIVRALQPTRNYALTAANILRVSGSDSLALDRLRGTAPEVYAYVVSDPTGYLAALSDAPEDQLTVEQASVFVDVVTDVAEWRPSALDAVVRRAEPTAVVGSLSDVPSSAWVALVAARRTTASFANVLAYVKERGEVDQPLVDLILESGSIEGAVDESAEDLTLVALAVVNSPSDSFTASDRARIVAALEPGVLPSTDIEPRAGDLIAELIAAQLIGDDEEAFTVRLMVDWSTQERAIRASTKYVELVGPSTLQPRFVAQLLSSNSVASAVQARVITLLGEWESLPQASFEAAADCSLSGRVRIGAPTILRLHRGGVAPDRIIRLLTVNSERISIDELREILRALKGEYAAVADPGRKRPRLPDNDAVRTVLERLRVAGIVSRFTPEKADKVRVFLHHF
ncbi:hypothetical protein DEI97_017045 [Curtobacterium sp. MCLR17_032]|uniref:YobI family P-loop NTPase n=1 Tax=Curtobacterium sp. MCLR17_032 TaxID=2175650 RepID=UPI0011B6DD5F|nr:hypothetical protein [Curtobacterium sp. MCLR17_032]WIE61428.1 hypothetical protein DEI97_017045 [Curtobacterium sp. MCLR17_032]